MRVFRMIGQAGAALWAFKLRSGFVVAAVALGIASLALIVASVDGAQRKAREIVEIFGPDAVFVLGGDIYNRTLGRRTMTLTTHDAERLRQSLPGARLVVPMRGRSGLTLRHGGEHTRVGRIIGATDHYADVWNWPMAEGRDFSERDVRQASRVILLGSIPARELFGDASPVGRTVFLGDSKVQFAMQVVGVLEERGQSTGGGRPMDDRAVIPLTTLTQRFNMDRKHFHALRVKFDGGDDPDIMAASVENLRSFLRHLHGLETTDPDDFTILTADEVLKFLSMLKGGLVAFLGVTAAVAVLVGGFVLANLFYLSVSERTAEIGLRKAMGARDRDILMQFLAEAVLLTLVGAALGIGLGIGFGQLLSNLDILEIRLSVRVVTISLASAAAIGVVFGLRPARSAARLDPIDALRGE